MSKRKKLKRITEALAMPGVLHFKKLNKNHWKKAKKPLLIELGCGRGAYTIALAKMFPDISFVGIDRKNDRLWFGARELATHNIANALFLEMPIGELGTYFSKGSVDEIWITFPDPFPKKRHEKNRLTSPLFLALYQRVLKPSGVLHLKTDDVALFDYSLASLTAAGFVVEFSTRDVHDGTDTAVPAKLAEILAIQTHFENKHRKTGKKICYVRAHLEK